MTIKKSLYDWCIENNRQDLLDRWDYDLNNCTPQEVSFASHKKRYFKCNKHKEHKSIFVILASITSGKQNIVCKECQSFAQVNIDKYGEGYFNKIWNADLNEDSPWDFAANAKNKYVYLNCPDVQYHIGYKTKAASFTQGQVKCRFCDSKIIHPLDSFAQRGISKYGKDFLEKFWDYDKNTVDPWTISKCCHKKVWIKCQDIDYHGSYDVLSGDFLNGKSFCPYCRSLRVHPLDSLAVKYPEVLNIWSDKNDKTPYDYVPGSANYIWLKCKDGIHNDFKGQVRTLVDRHFECIECTRQLNSSQLQRFVEQYIESKYKYPLFHEYNCTITCINPITNHKLPYDNEIVINNECHLMIEVMGPQHYYITNLTQKAAKTYHRTEQEQLAYQKYKDKIKKEYVESLDQYYYLELPYYVIHKSDQYQSIIDTKISEILSNNNTT